MGDMDLMSKLLTDPDTLLPEEQRTVAQRLGIKKGFLSAAVNTFADPVVLIAFMLSKRFPTLNWLKGTIPERYVGTANEFTGISRYTRPVETYFRGTTIPRLVGLKAIREEEVRKIGSKLLKNMDRPRWKEEMPTVSMLLEGQQTTGATPELRRVADSIRADMNEMWKFLGQTKKIVRRGKGDVRWATAEEWKSSEAPRYLRDYLPHIPLLGEESIIQVDGRAALKKMSGGKRRHTYDLARMSPEDVWTPDASGRLTSDFVRYQEFLNATQGQIYNTRLFARKRHNIALASHQGQANFETDLNIVLQKYVQSVARTYAVNAPITDVERALATVVRADGTRDMPTREPIMVQIINEGLKAAGAGKMSRRPVLGTNKIEQRIVPGTLNPMAKTALNDLVRAVAGRADEGEIVWGNLFNSVGSHFSRTVGNLTGKQLSEADRAIRTIRGSQSYRSMTNGVTSYFYASTLGLNPWI